MGRQVRSYTGNHDDPDHEDPGHAQAAMRLARWLIRLAGLRRLGLRAFPRLREEQDCQHREQRGG